MVRTRFGRKTTGILATLTVVAAMGLMSHGTAVAATSPAVKPTGKNHTDGTTGDKRDYDARQGSSAASKGAISRRAASSSSRLATQQLRSSLGSQALVEMDGTTGTPRIVARLDGFLTRASSKAPTRVVMDYVSAHLAALGLTRNDLATFQLRRDYRDLIGTHHLSWSQWQDGVEVFGNGLQANVTRSGRLLSLGGSPISGLYTPKRGGQRVATKGAAISAARADVAEPRTAGPRDTARKVLFVGPSGPRPAWQVVTMSAQHPTLSVVDADSGAVVFRKSLRDDATNPDATTDSSGLAFAYFPKHVPGGTQRTIDFTARGWMSSRATRLIGNNSHTYSDVNDNNLPDSTEEVPPSSPHKWNYHLQPFTLPGVSFCNNPYPCSWDPNTPFSWQTNRAQNATQVFAFVNNWHDHLAAAPIGFSEAAGNFQKVNRTGLGAGGDPVDTQTDDGANTDNGLPDGNHIDNANMDTPPDGQAPTMQMYLQHAPGAAYPDDDPFSPTNVGDEADTVYHEYTHGLSNRLVIDATGNSTLGEVQAGAMGEAWSDWYAMDYLVNKGLQTDKAGVADLVIFQYDGEGVALDRTEPIDCKVGVDSPRCTGGTTGHGGGYTYADYGNIVGGPEVHGDGELWAQTLWDLRHQIGPWRTEKLVTRAMELTPSNPSFLDERNAILLADEAAYGGRHHYGIWKVFAHRGMGFYAGSLGGDDTNPGADFHQPPSTTATGTITGTVTDADSGLPAKGLTVSLAFQGAPGEANPSTTTAADGRYSLGPVLVGTYPKISVSGAGYDPVRSTVRVTRSGAVKNFAVRRDWASTTGGAQISDFTGPDFGPPCSPTEAIDNSQAAGWVTFTGTGDPTNVFVPHQITIKLPQPITLSQFAIDPASACGTGGSASTGQYKIETSPDGTAWTTAATGTFTIDDRGVLTPVAPTAGTANVQYVRVTPLGNQTPDFANNCPGGGFGGCTYTSLTEVEVYGSPS